MNCSTCQRPKTDSKPVSITQWVSICNCELLDPADLEISVTICKQCGKRVSTGREGSLTTHVFFSDSCKCVRPNSTELADTIRTAVDRDASETEFELELDADEFPIQRYKPIREIGRGGGGRVFICSDELLHRKVAVKVLNSVDEETLIEFQNEAKLTSQLRHPNIVAVQDFGLTPTNSPYMVLEFLPGITLSQYIWQQGALTTDEVIAIFSKITDALCYAHNKSIFHRDLKPANILLCESPTGEFEVKLIDFGVAFCKTGTVSINAQGRTMVGTPNYMSPDQILGLTFDSRSEVYTLGCCIFEALTGKPPFRSDSDLELFGMHTEMKPPDLAEVRPEKSFPEELQSIVDRCLTKEREERFQTIAELHESLTEYSGSSSQTIDIEDSRQSGSSDDRVSTGVPVSLMVVIPLVTLVVIAGFITYSMNSRESDLGSTPATRSEKYVEIKDGDSVKFIGRIESGMFTYRPASRGTVSDSDLALLRDAPSLDCLRLNKSSLTGEGLKSLRGKHLKALYLADSRLTDTGIRLIGEFDTLQSLALGRVDMSGKLHHLEALQSLRRMMLNGCHLNDTDIVHLVRLGAIEELEIGFNPGVSSAGVQMLSRLPQLSRLDLTECVLSDKDLTEIDFSRFQSLKSLQLLDSANITSAGVQALEARYPGIRVLAMPF